MRNRATLAIFGADVIPMTPNCGGAEAEALAVSGDRILAVGTTEEIRSLTDEQTLILDLGGKAILPGFIDTLVHFVQTGYALKGPDVYGCLTVNEVLEMVREAVSLHDRNEPIYLHRCRFSDLDRPLTRWDLDRVASRNPVGIGSVWAHACVINSRALEGVGLSPETAGIETEPGTREPTGKMTAQADILAERFFYDSLEESARVEALWQASRAALRKGITTIHAAEGREAYSKRDAEVLLKERDSLPIRILLYYQGTNLDRALELSVKGIADVWCDGSYDDYSAALLEPYSDNPSTKGKLNFTQGELNELVWKAHSLGLQVGVHAVGDAAIEQVLNAFQYCSQIDSNFASRRHRLDHFVIPTNAQIDRARDLGIGVAMQPLLGIGPRKMVADRLGPERVERYHAYRRIVDAGLLVAGGSDSDFAPMDPMAGVHVLVNQPVSNRRLDVAEALTLFTVNGSLIAGEENLKGTIEPGKLADLVVLGSNPLHANPSSLKDIPVEMTIVGGKVAFEL